MILSEGSWAVKEGDEERLPARALPSIKQH
jgi:hypothetical protein